MLTMGLLDFFFSKPDKPKARGDVWHYFTKVVGATYKNDDGSSRQGIIQSCKSGERLNFTHDENNAYDKYAVMVCRENGEQLGFVKTDMGREVVQRSHSGHGYTVFITNITGGEGKKKTLGVNLLVVVSKPDAPTDSLQKYINSIDLGLR